MQIVDLDNREVHYAYSHIFKNMAFMRGHVDAVTFTKAFYSGAGRDYPQCELDIELEAKDIESSLDHRWAKFTKGIGWDFSMREDDEGAEPITIRGMK